MGKLRSEILQKLDTALVMNDPRVIYETLIKKRCSDSHWSKTKKLMADCQLPMDQQGFQVLINLRKVSPRYFSKYHEIKNELSALGKKLLPAIGDGITGKQFLDLLDKLEVSPNQSTVSRWFKGIGGFKEKTYSKQLILPVVAVALIYKSKSQRSDLANISFE